MAPDKAALAAAEAEAAAAAAAAAGKKGKGGKPAKVDSKPATTAGLVKGKAGEHQQTLVLLCTSLCMRHASMLAVL